MKISESKLAVLKKSFVCSLLIISLIVAGIFSYRNLALWLFLSDPLPQNLDYICTFAGAPQREPYSVQLMKQYSQAVWIVSTSRKNFKKWAFEQGVDSSKIIITPKCNSTLEEITSFREIITRISKETHNSSQKGSWPLIGFVSSPYHMRRIAILFGLSKNDTFKKAVFLPVPMEKTQFSHEKVRFWWKDQYLKRIVNLELKKTAGNIALKIPFLGELLKKYAHKP